MKIYGTTEPSSDNFNFSKSGDLFFVSIYFERRNIPGLVFGYIWKQNDRIIPTAINYFLKIKRENGGGGVQGFRGFVGVKDKFNPKVSRLLLSNSKFFCMISSSFQVFEHNGNKLITLFGVDYPLNETLHQHLKMLSLMNIKNVN